MPSPRALPFRAGPYECYQYLGGTLAEVYLARDLRTGFNRVLKVLRVGYGVDSEHMKRFLAEAQAALRCSHPNIVTTYEAEQVPGLGYIAMEHLQGVTLKVMLERGQLRTMPQRIDIAWQVAQGLVYLHRHNIIHRDIKADNVHIGFNGAAKIFDFGIARQKDQQITREGQILGTPLYMSPEQVRGDAATPASDIYSFGVLLFLLFTGSFPVRGVSREDLYAAVIFYPPDLTPLQGKGIPPAVIELITQCLGKQPDSRPPSFQQIAERLRPLVSASISGASPVAAARKRAWNWPLWLLVCLLLIASAGAAAWYSSRPVLPAPRIVTRAGFMLLVPAGKAWIGQDRHEVDVSAYYIDRAEASNEAYAEFARDTGRDLSPAFRDLPASFPVVDVTYDDAAAFCAWAGKRLPTAIEWEKAARGTDGRLYPWGNQPRLDLVNVPRANEPHQLQPVESNLGGASPYGAINLLGNVWEWVAKSEPLEENDLREYILNPPLTRGERAFQIRGGSFQHALDLRQAVWDFAVAPARLKRSDIGIRCAR